jgi:2-iminobutanoate/2-iminopropanoate deaminase
MPRKTFSHPNSSPNVPLSPAARAGDMVFISGQVPTDASGNIVGNNVTEQAHQVFKNCQSALTDVNYFAAMNEVYRQYFPESPPTRTTVGTPLARLGLLIEIDMIAYAPQ